MNKRMFFLFCFFLISFNSLGIFASDSEAAAASSAASAAASVAAAPGVEERLLSSAEIRENVAPGTQLFKRDGDALIPLEEGESVPSSLLYLKAPEGKELEDQLDFLCQHDGIMFWTPEDFKWVFVEGYSPSMEEAGRVIMQRGAFRYGSRSGLSYEEVQFSLGADTSYDHQIKFYQSEDLHTASYTLYVIQGVLEQKTFFPEELSLKDSELAEGVQKFLDDHAPILRLMQKEQERRFVCPTCSGYLGHLIKEKDNKATQLNRKEADKELEKARKQLEEVEERLSNGDPVEEEKAYLLKKISDIEHLRTLEVNSLALLAESRGNGLSLFLCPGCSHFFSWLGKGCSNVKCQNCHSGTKTCAWCLNGTTGVKHSRLCNGEVRKAQENGTPCPAAKLCTCAAEEESP